MAINNNNNCGMYEFNKNMNYMNNFNNFPMNPINNNICMNNVDQFAAYNGIIPIQNKPEICDNFGGQLNQMNPINNANVANNINIQNNFQIQNFNLNEKKEDLNKINTNEEININFSFLNSMVFKVTAKPNETLKDIIYRFRIMECPQELKKSLSIGLFHASKVDQSKTIKELGIQNCEKILFMDKPNQKKEEFIFTEREEEQMNKLREEFDEKYMLKPKNVDNKNKINNNGNKVNNKEKEKYEHKFRRFIESKDKFIGITVNEHQDKLVYCLTNVKWKCDNCKIKYKKEAGRYYCSLCDYSMCESCHYLKKYFMKKSFPKGTKPSNENVQVHFFNAAYHRHRLAFCRISRNFNYYNGWKCTNCGEEYDNDQWCFYCTSCNFYLCCECCGYK